MKLVQISFVVIALLQFTVVEADFLSWMKSTIFGDYADVEVNVDGSATPPPLSALQKIELMKKSTENIASGKALESLKDVLSILESDPENEDANLVAGTILVQENRSEEAKDFLYGAVVASDWSNMIAVAQFCFAMINTKEYDLAEKAAFQALEKYKNDHKQDKDKDKDKEVGTPETKRVFEILGNVLGEIYLRKGDYEDASKWFLTSANANPKGSADIWLKASTMKFPQQARNIETAQSVLMQAVQQFGEDSVIVFNLAVATFLSGQVEQSVLLYQSALSLDSERMKSSQDGAAEGVTSIPDAWASLGTAMHTIGRWQEAHDSYERAYKIQPQSIVLLANWAKLLCNPSVKLYDQGREIVNAALALDNTNADVQQAVTLCKQ